LTWVFPMSSWPQKKYATSFMVGFMTRPTITGYNLRGELQRLSPAEPIRRLARWLSPRSTILLSYPAKLTPRWDLQHPHPELLEFLNRDRDQYKTLLESFLDFTPSFRGIKKTTPGRMSVEPYWKNGWLPPLDGISIYSMLAQHKPVTYMEVGSGNSTKFAHLAIREQALQTRVISIDPYPRAEIDSFCNQSIRAHLEDVDPLTFETLQANDVLFVDDSHHAFMNSDVTVFFLEILPRLRPGVIVGIHDIFLPYDYSAKLRKYFFSEQYLLACYLLAGWQRLRVLLPLFFASQDQELKQVLAPLWQQPEMADLPTHAGTFWLQIME
jgi:hypothetical protein